MLSQPYNSNARSVPTSPDPGCNSLRTNSTGILGLFTADLHLAAAAKHRRTNASPVTKGTPGCLLATIAFTAVTLSVMVASL